MLFPIISSLAGSFAVANAHFLLNYPQTRGFDETLEPSFCGGFPSAFNRTTFPLSGGFVSITSEHPKANIDMLISFDPNPTTYAQFNTTPSGQTYPFLVPFTVMNAQGDACFPVNISSLGVAQAQNGVNATIMVQFDGGDGQLYQCADVILSDAFTVPPSTKCDNATGAFSNSTSGAAPASASSMMLISFFGTMLLYVLGFD